MVVKCFLKKANSDLIGDYPPLIGRIVFDLANYKK
jgi:hypothetical protein